MSRSRRPHALIHAAVAGGRPPGVPRAAVVRGPCAAPGGTADPPNVGVWDHGSHHPIQVVLAWAPAPGDVRNARADPRSAAVAPGRPCRRFRCISAVSHRNHQRGATHHPWRRRRLSSNPAFPNTCVSRSTRIYAFQRAAVARARPPAASRGRVYVLCGHRGHRRPAGHRGSGPRHPAPKCESFSVISWSRRCPNRPGSSRSVSVAKGGTRQREEGSRWCPRPLSGRGF